MFSGQYKFYNSSGLIAISNNLITNAGKAQIMRYLAGATPQIGDAIAVGIGDSPVTIDDLRLQFEIENQRLQQIGVNTIDSKLVFKASLNPGPSARISEVGLCAFKSTATGVGASRILTSADPVTENWIGATWDVGSRLSAESLLLNPNASALTTAQFAGFGQNLSGYSNADEFVIAYEALANIANIIVYFHTTDQDYYTGIFNNSGSGYKIASKLKNDFTSVGSPRWDDISFLRIGATATAAGAGAARFDALRIERNTNIDSNSVLVSRSRLNVPIIKAASEPLDIEYTVKFAL